MNIVIRRLVVEYNVEGNERPDSYIQQADLFVKNTLLPLLEKLFLKEEFHQGITLNLPHVELDLDFSKSVNSLSGLLTLSETQLTEVIQRQLAEQVKNKATQIPLGHGSWQQFFFIIAHSYKHWSYRFTSQQEFENDLSGNLAILLNDTNWREEFVRIISNENTLKRLQNVVTFEFLKTIFVGIADFYLQEIPVIANKIRELLEAEHFFAPNAKPFSTVIAFYTWLLVPHRQREKIVLLQSAFKKSDEEGERDERDRTIEEYPAQIFWKKIELIISPAASRAIKNNKKQKPSHKFPLSANSVEFQNASTPTTASVTEPETNSQTDARKKTIEIAEKEDAIAEGLFCKNVGIVIIAPFFDTLFERLKMKKGYELKNPAQAIYLIEYLAGTNEYFEQDLLLAKILCGVEIEEVLEPKGKFSKKEITEAKELLSSLNTHWPAIKNTGAETIQEVFFQRPGKLMIKEEEVVVQLEKRTEDILLSYIPWTFKMIRLPWMKKVLRVEWDF